MNPVKISFKELQAKLTNLQKVSESSTYSPGRSRELNISFGPITYDDCLNTLDKLYKSAAAKRMFKG